MTKNVKNHPSLRMLRAGFGIFIFLVFLFSFFLKTDVKAEDPSPGGVPTVPASPSCPPIKNASWFLPNCAYYEGTASEQTCGCRNINVFLELLVTFANWIFAIVGAAALVMFVYGGYTMLTSAGAAEKVKKGKTILTSAVVGLIIVFTAQLGVRFLLNTLVANPESAVNGLQVTLPDDTTTK